MNPRIYTQKKRLIRALGVLYSKLNSTPPKPPFILPSFCIRLGAGTNPAYVVPMTKPTKKGAKPKKSMEPKRFNRAVSIQDPLRRVTKPLIKTHGFSDPQIFHQWRAIVGEQLAGVSCPMRLSRQGASKMGGSTLKVRVLGAAALEFEHMSPQILERINRFYGYKAVARISLEQGPLPLRKKQVQHRPRKLSKREVAEIEESTKGIGDDELRQSLQSLGKAIRANRTP